MNVLQTHLNTMQRDMRRFYQSNALYVQELGSFTSGAIQTVM